MLWVTSSRRRALSGGRATFATVSFVPLQGPATLTVTHPPRDSEVEFTGGPGGTRDRVVRLPMRGAIPVLSRALRADDAHPSVGLLGGAVTLGVARRWSNVPLTAAAPLVLLSGSIALGTSESAAKLVQGVGFAIVLVGWLVVRAHRSRPPVQNGSGSLSKGNLDDATFPGRRPPPDMERTRVRTQDEHRSATGC